MCQFASGLEAAEMLEEEDGVKAEIIDSLTIAQWMQKRSRGLWQKRRCVVVQKS